MLVIRRPTSSTVLYSISTKNPAQTLADHARNAVVLLLRIAIAVLAIGIVYREYERLFTNDDGYYASMSAQSQLLRQIESRTTFASGNLTTLSRLIFSAILTWIVCRRGYVEESLFVMRGLGVQTSTSSSTYLWTSSTRFIPTTAIQDIFIHEAFIGFKIKFYLSIVVENEPEAVVVFPSILPRLDVLEPVWRDARACLYEPKT